jgi:hypothetical protein
VYIRTSSLNRWTQGYFRLPPPGTLRRSKVADTARPLPKAVFIGGIGEIAMIAGALGALFLTLALPYQGDEH